MWICHSDDDVTCVHLFEMQRPVRLLKYIQSEDKKKIDFSLFCMVGSEHIPTELRRVKNLQPVTNHIFPFIIVEKRFINNSINENGL